MNKLIEILVEEEKNSLEHIPLSYILATEVADEPLLPVVYRIDTHGYVQIQKDYFKHISRVY
ncbi:hypothetical protein [Taibaiella chishuiensis]|uniref:Uncharacterized protein n=1 Tax=Taibaiella chishuiensis TaxID=1434707 RepID=A0A2P8DAD7_9BACT|nr:hypothetical protein [Taibaiella chishuiensis]PSK94190.1 hypothetical protein B0I18_101345 [Taibaiella chishuiensis]